MISTHPGLKHLWPQQPLLWLFVFGLLFVLVFLANDGLLAMLSSSFQSIPDRIALIFLPAFIRVAAVLVAGLAGLIGISLGSFVISYFYVGDDLGYSFLISVTSASGIFMAYWLMLKVLSSEKIPFTLVNLVVLTVLYSALNAIIHGMIWGLIDFEEVIRLQDIAYMMLGDLVGVVLGFYITRLLIRSYQRVKA